MSCGSCNHSPCSCDDVCDPNNEPLASALNNFIASFFGAVGKTCVDGQVQWILPCDLNNGLPGFERRQGEGVACYLLRLFDYLQSLSAGISVSDEGVVISNPATSLNFVGDGVVATAAGSEVTITITAASCAAFYDKIAINGVCYDTWQAAYDANVGVATPTLMLVGQGSTFGNLVLTGNYNSNIIPVGFGIGVSQLGTISGSGFTVVISAHNLTIGDITSSGAVITIGGDDVIFGAISSANGAGVGGAVTVGTKITTGTIDSSGTGALGGAVVLGREVISGVITASGLTGGAVTLGDECITGSILSNPTVAPGTGGTITISDDCFVGSVDNSGTVAGTFGGTILIGDRCEATTVISLGTAGGGPVTIGEGFLGTSIDARATVSGIGGAVVVSHRLTLMGAAGINCSGVLNGGAVTIGQNANLSLGSVTATAGTGNSGPIILSDGAHYTGLVVSAGTNVGNIHIGKFCTVGAITAIATSGTRGTFDILDGTTIGGVIIATSLGNCGAVNIGNSVTITGTALMGANSGNAALATIGRGCSLGEFRIGSNTGNATGIIVGQATTIGLIYVGAGGGGTQSGSAVIGEGAHASDVYTSSAGAGGNSGSIIMEPGATARYLDSSSVSGLGGDITLRNSNIISGHPSGIAIAMGSSNPGTIISLNSRIRDRIDSVNGTSWFRDLVASTPDANRDFITNLTASGSQFTNCLIVPHGTGVSMQAAAPQMVIAYFLLQKNAFPVNVTISEGSETTSPNLIAP